jgi:hypothetical protein
MKKGLLLLLALFTTPAMGQTPTVPYRDLSVPTVQAQVPVRANFSFTCYSYWQPGTEQITTAGNVITLTLPIDFKPGSICFDPPLRESASVTLGQFAAGEYTLVLQPLAPVPPQPGVNYSPVSVPFTVMAGAPMYSNLRIFPNPAYVGQLITARISARDFYAMCFEGPLTDIQRVGNVVTLSIRESDFSGCVIGVPPPGPHEFDTAIGQFPEGNYTLQVQLVPDISGGAPQLVLTGSFAVGAALAIPLASNTLLALLALGMVLVAGWQWRRVR